MTDTDKAPRSITLSDIDAHGNVVVWDHGPHEEAPEPVPALAHDSDAYKAFVAKHQADREEWHRVHGDGPVPLTMHSGDAAGALGSDPERYSLDPTADDDADVSTEIKAIQERRVEAEKVAKDRAEAAQLLADHKVAATTVMANRAAAALVEKAPKPVDASPAPARAPLNDLEAAARKAEAIAEVDQDEADRLRRINADQALVEAARAKASESRHAANEARRLADIGA